MCSSSHDVNLSKLLLFKLLFCQTRALRLFFLLLALASAASSAGFEAGVARAKITPEGPIWMSGFMGRERPSEGVRDDLWAKALALRDAGGVTVIVTADLIGLPGAMTDRVAAALEKRHRVPRARVLFNASHTHTGPVVEGNLPTMFDLTAGHQRRVHEFAVRLEAKLAEVAEAAIADLAPARLAVANGSVGFAANRRVVSPEGVKFGVDRSAPSDHDVPVIRVTAPDGRVRAVLFGYACHNTTMGGAMHISGDWAGAAQRAVERSHTGATALFLMLCGGDQGPDPKGSYEEAATNGETLAREVDRVLAGKLDAVAGPVRAGWQVIRLNLEPHTRQTFERDREHKDASMARRARAMVRAYDAGKPVTEVAYPVQAIRFGRDLAIVALGGEVVVDYALRLKKEFPKERLIVAGYSNDVMCYIPSARVLREGGYEAVNAMKHYGLPGPLKPEVEEQIVGAVRSIMAGLGAAK